MRTSTAKRVRYSTGAGAERDRDCADGGRRRGGDQRRGDVGGAGTSGWQMTFYIPPFKEVLSDVKLVGKRKAIGYLPFLARRKSLFIVPIQEHELERLPMS